MKKKFVFGIFFLVFVLGIVFAHYSMEDIDIPESVVQEKMNGLFPVTGSKLFIKYELSNPAVRFEENGTITLDVDGTVGMEERFAPASVSVNGVLDYVPLTGEFFFRDAKIIKFDMGDIQLHDGDMNRVEKIADFALGSERFGKLKGFAKSKVGEKYRAEFIEKSADSIQVVVLQTLERKAVYTLRPNDIKQQAAKLLLNDIVVSEGVMQVKLSLFQGVYIIILYVLAFLSALGLAFSLIRYGGAASLVVVTN